MDAAKRFYESGLIRGGFDSNLSRLLESLKIRLVNGK